MKFLPASKLKGPNEMSNTSSTAQVVLCVADTKLVLGNVCVATVFNGRSLGDFATLLAIAGTSFGTTRSLYRWLESHGEDYVRLERGRDRHEIASMDLLDAPPASWVDLMVTIFVAETATATVAQTTAKQGGAFLANQVRMLQRDSAFHVAYSRGWLKVLHAGEQMALQSAVRHRLPLALRWVESRDPGSVEAFALACAPLLELRAVDLPDATPNEIGWDAARARARALPERLWNIVRFKDTALVA